MYSNASKIMNIALLGGSFNPPHIGHLMISQQVLDFADVDQVWFLPNHGQIPPKPVESVAHRLAMTRLLEAPRTAVSTIELDHKLDGDTVNLLPHLPGENTYSFIIGSDQLPTFHLWGRWKKLLERMPFLVFPRYGYPNEPLYPSMKLVTHEFLIGSNISSTKIRERIRLGMSVDEFVPKAVGAYIKRHDLYHLMVE